MVSRAVAPAGAAAGILLDRLLGEPSIDPHPVACFGRAMGALESAIYEPSRPAGALHACAGLALGAAVGTTVRSTTLASYLAIAGRALEESASAVQGALEAGDVARARELLPALVGRDPAGLDEKEISRAVVESVAENTVDAVVAPALWGAVAGAPGALGYRAVNTMDAMVGHRSERYLAYGWASARVDDVAGWVPARLTALLVAAVRPRRAAATWRAVRRDAPAHPSPNSGVAEAAFAAALDLRLGGESRYGDRVELRPTLGDGRPPDSHDIARASRLARDVGLALAGGLAASAVTGLGVRCRRTR